MDFSDTTQKILALLIAYRRTHAGMSNDDDLEAVCRAHGPVIERFVRQGAPLHAILPAFPCKSPSPGKVLGRLPDMAERRSLIFLDELFQDIAALHAPGASLSICSDGRVFAECLDIPDVEISAYADALKAMCAEEGCRHIDFFQLEDVPAYRHLAHDPEGLRQALLRDHGQSPEALRASLLTTAQGKAMYCALTRFMLEDRADDIACTSRTQAQKRARSRALWTLSCSEAWGQLLAEQWPDALRLSIHPQMPDAPKLGIRLLDGADDWLTPWHATLLDDPGGPRLLHRRQLDESCLVPVLKDGRPSHFRRPRLSEAVQMAASREWTCLKPLPGNPAFGALWDMEPGYASVDARMLVGLVRRHGLLVLRGATPGKDIATLAAFASSLGTPMAWPQGTVVAIAEEDGAHSHLVSTDPMPMHWDGMFLPLIPELLLFSCRQATRGGGGHTVFAWTPGVLHGASADDRESWGCTTGSYRLATSLFTGRVRAPLVQAHPVTGYPVLRYVGPETRTGTQGVSRRFTGEPEALRGLDEALGRCPKFS